MRGSKSLKDLDNCIECQLEEDTSGLLCDRHTKNHPHDNYGEPLPLVNSPRMGMCGYDGSANPPD
ncbi:hypothetical protein TUMEXPCC7403_07445 [Tumidithrix helvetica PCC 7403]|uniref:hypothetical protein n=1 Tax=Tumidithrix helvetica TaxID=3457545 RepID=UPI003C9B2D3B